MGDFSDEITCFLSLILKSSEEPSSMKGNCAMYFEDHKLLTGKKMMDMFFYSLHVLYQDDSFSQDQVQMFSPINPMHFSQG